MDVLQSITWSRNWSWSRSQRWSRGQKNVAIALLWQTKGVGERAIEEGMGEYETRHLLICWVTGSQIRCVDMGAGFARGSPRFFTSRSRIDVFGAENV